MNTPNAIEIRALTKYYSGFTLGPVDLNVATGGIYGLIGPNGAGKSTLIDLMFGMGSADGGSIQVNGFDHTKDEVAVKQRAAYVSPDLSYAAWGRVERAIQFVRGFRPTWDDSYCWSLMGRLGINTHEKIAELSFGGRIKLSLVLALAWHPAVLVLDEPTTGLDAHSKQAVFAELLAAVKDETRTVLISSHQISDLERFTDQIGILHRGRMITEGSTGDLIARYAQAEFTTENSDIISQLKGLTVQQHESSRWRAMLDLESCPPESLKQQGATDLQTHPLTLEEIFLTLTK